MTTGNPTTTASVTIMKTINATVSANAIALSLMKLRDPSRHKRY